MTTTTFEVLISSMPDGLDRAILRTLSFHVGKKNAIGRSELVVTLAGFHAHERQVRQCIHDLRREGHLICSTPGEDGGYYMAATLAEFDEFCERELHPKAIDMLETESAMKMSARQRFGEASQPSLLG